MAAYNISFVSGLMSMDGFKTPLALTGTEDSPLVLEKGEGFYEWRDDDLLLADGRTVSQANREKVHRMIDAWLDEVEFEV